MNKNWPLFFVRFVTAITFFGSTSEMMASKSISAHEVIPFVWFTLTIIALFRFPRVGVGMFFIAFIIRSLNSLKDTTHGPAFVGTFAALLIISTIAVYAFIREKPANLAQNTVKD